MKINTKKNITFLLSPLAFSITPYALSRLSDDFYNCSRNFKPKYYPLINYFLYLRSIELGLKASILHKSNTKEDKLFLKNKVGHNLERLVEKFKNLPTNQNPLSEPDIEILLNINKLYNKKGFEYFTTDMILSAMKAYKNIPKIDKVAKISEKINKFLVVNKYFINS